MRQRFGGIYAFQHARPKDLEFHSEVNGPAWGAHDPDVEQILNYHERTPNALALPRIWAWDDDDGKAFLRCQDDPEGYGETMARLWDGQLLEWEEETKRRGRRFPEREQVYVSLFCEPPIWKHELRDGLVRAEIAFVNRMIELSRPVGAGRWAVGHPAELVDGDGSPPDYSPYEGILNLVVRYQSQIILCLDEYWYPDLGPQEGYGWYFGRHQYVDSAISRIGLTEIGCDALVLEERFKNQPGERGWRGRVSPGRIANDIGWAVVHAQPRVEFALGFIIDHGGWKSFDLHDAYPQILTVVQDIREMPEPAQEQPVQVYIPSVSSGTSFTVEGKPEPAFSRVMDFIIKWEGETLTTDTNGALVKYGINQEANPDIDVPNLTKDDALAIYFARYWRASGSHRLQWPLNLAHMNAAVNTGVSQADDFLVEANGSLGRYTTVQRDWYDALEGYSKEVHSAWRNRLDDLIDYAVNQ